MGDNDQPRTDQWTDFAGKYLKANMIEKWPSKHAILNIEAHYDDDDEAHLLIQVEALNKKWKIELNKTNQKILKDLGIKAPKELIGKVITFEKIKTMNPSTKERVDSFSVLSIE